MQKSVSLLVPLGDHPVPLSIIATYCSRWGKCAHSYIMDIGSEINVQCEWHKPLDTPVCSGDCYDSGFYFIANYTTDGLIDPR